MKILNNKVAVITGSARGLGKAIAERYASLGANIVINYSKDKASADEVVSNITAMGVKVIAVQADVSVVADIERLFEEAIKAFGKIDIVVANAGIEMVETPVAEFTESQFDKLFSINTKGAYFTMQQAAKKVENNGRIIYIASSTTAFPIPGMAIYGGSKTTPRYMVDVLSKEIGHKGITVNTIIPFAVDHSGIFADENSYPELRKSLIDSCPMGRLAEVEDVANIAEFFASDLSSFVNGQHLLVNGGANQ
ncbi:3-oxoacyl-[acyl-carrier protein] reductase [Flavobacterium sp. CF108]|uniref:SDR family oxidoreductase n=1 Tax=Flavobacterium panici TaxID=2654843 RepID=A0A9N8J224_9FLAO|nr:MULTISPECIES: SDR family oxidoreductase [Flavobacterium]CAC9974066.1 SDR family oxidoreductase [Flavobacterium panici]SEO42390.1 3-oxoacyl-[acyl-carrier protein] reductase [Flavobacterium sp. fv08]SHH68073.1 3-oxoacyl-[acyl-carrier protein] reductase [Flavobacterium sp. CF108]